MEPQQKPSFIHRLKTLIIGGKHDIEDTSLFHKLSLIAFFAWVAETEGVSVPRPGRVAIRPLGCWDTPLAFTVRRGRRVLLFDLDPQANATSGLGNVVVDSKFTKIDGSTYQSPDYDTAAHKVEITVSSGAGNVNVNNY